ncbi:MAG: heparin lyase I family protein [Verrucomicrobia bacterium]|nr:heparin lyase I family protein [Verrucomicrobiota bacterium]
MNQPLVMRSTGLVLLVLFAMTAPLSARVVVKAGYENGLEDNGNPEIGVVEPEPDRIEATSLRARAGGWSLRTELRYGDSTPVGIRAECNTRFAGTEPIIERGVTKFYGFSVCLDPDFEWDSNGDILFQVKQSDSGPSFHMMADEGKFKFHYANNENLEGVTSPYFEAAGYERGVWYDFVLELLPQYTGNGYFKFYYKKATDSEYTELIHYTGSTLLNDRDGYIKWGVYKSTWENTPTDSTLRVVYHDNIAVATTFAEADPSVYSSGGGSSSTDSFQSNSWSGGAGWSADWVVVDASKAYPPELVELSGNYCVQIRRGDNLHSITRTLDSGIAGGTLNFKWDIDSMDNASEYGYAEVFDGAWNTVWSMNDSGNGTDTDASPDNLQQETIDLSAYGTVTQIRFRQSTNTREGDYLYVDDVELTSEDDLFLIWAAEYGLSGTDADMLSDPDGDRLNNLMEYALGGSPTNSADSAAVFPNLGKSSDQSFQGLEYVYRRRIDAAALGLSYWVELTPELIGASWSTNGYEETGSAAINDDFEMVTNRIPTEAASGFIRLTVEAE